MVQVLQKGYRLGDRVLRPAHGWWSLRPRWTTEPLRDARRREERVGRTRSRRRTARSRAGTTPMRTRATRTPRSASRRSRTHTTCCRIPRSVSGTTRSARPTAAAVPEAGFNWSAAEGFDFGDLGNLGDLFGGMFGGHGWAGCAASPGSARERRRGAGQPVVRGRPQGRRDEDPGSPSRWRVTPATGRAPGRVRRRSVRPQRGFARGVIAESQGFFSLSQPCPRCRGTGSIIEEPCPTCRGAGRERRTKRYTGEDPGGRQGRIADPAEGQGRGRLGRSARRATSTSSRASSRRSLHPARRRPGSSRRRSRSPTPRSATTAPVPTPDGDDQGEGARRHRGREAPPRQGQGRAAG